MSNLTRHFKRSHALKDKKSADWLEAYSSIKKNKNSTKKISRLMMNFVIWFCHANMPMNQLDNDLLWPILHPDLKLDSYDTFRYKLIPGLLLQLKLELSEKLDKAVSICLIPDCWTCSL